MNKLLLKIFGTIVFVNFLITLPIIPLANAVEIDPQILLEAVDDNLWSNTKYIEGRLIINNGRLERTLEMVSWMEGVERSYSFYKSPPRERGTKMLKIGSI